MVQKIPPDPYKTDTDAVQVLQLKPMSARGGVSVKGVSLSRGFSLSSGVSVQGVSLSRVSLSSGVSVKEVSLSRGGSLNNCIYIFNKFLKILDPPLTKYQFKVSTSPSGQVS